jgi:hypothetical protein
MPHLDIFLETDPSAAADFELPNLIKICLDQAAVARMLAARNAYEINLELGFSGISGEFVGVNYCVQSDEDPDQYRSWHPRPSDADVSTAECPQCDEFLMHVDADGYRFGMRIYDSRSLVRMRSESFSFEDFEEVLRDWRSLELAESIDSAMSGSSASSASNSSSMSL